MCCVALMRIARLARNALLAPGIGTGRMAPNTRRVPPTGTSSWNRRRCAESDPTSTINGPTAIDSARSGVAVRWAVVSHASYFDSNAQIASRCAGVLSLKSRFSVINGQDAR